MSESYEQEGILETMLSDVPDTLDKREGSIIYNTLSPVAAFLAEQNYMLAYMFNLLYADTAEEDWLDRVCSDFGVTRKAATYATRQINTFDSSGAAMDCTIGDRFAVEDVTFALTEKIAVGQYKAVCEQSGVTGNLYSGAILPVDNINGLGSAVLVSTPLIAARDKETDDDYRTRFYTSVRQAAFGGNIADYEEKVLAIDGVGAVKVFTANEIGTAGKVVIVIGDADGKTTSETLVSTVQGLMGSGGSGIAPIGHTVTVKTAMIQIVDVTASIKLKSGASFSVVQPLVAAAIKNYIDSAGFTDEKVYLSKIEAAMLNASDSILDVTASIIGSTGNLTLSKTFTGYDTTGFQLTGYVVPVSGTITVTEAV